MPSAAFTGTPMRRVGDQANEWEVLPELVRHVLDHQRVDDHGAPRTEDKGLGAAFRWLIPKHPVSRRLIRCAHGSPR